jgi:hypothetical protein
MLETRVLMCLRLREGVLLEVRAHWQSPSSAFSESSEDTIAISHSWQSICAKQDLTKTNRRLLKAA